MQRHFFSTLHPLCTVIFATATVLAFVLLRDSSFNFHCYTQRCYTQLPLLYTSTQKLAQKCAATSRNFLRKRLQSALTLANQLLRIAQYKRVGVHMCVGVPVERERERMYNKSPSMSWFDNFYSKFSPIVGLFQDLPGWLD